MDDDALYARVYDGLGGFYRFLELASPDARRIELGGVACMVTASSPDRSICNAVRYESAPSLAGALPQLEQTYADAGVQAWTVWVHPGDRDSARLLERAGHVVDATPQAMAFELDRFERRPSPSVDIRPADDLDAVGHLNDIAYGYVDDFTRMLSRRPSGAYRFYVAHVDGEPAACAGAFDHGDNCDITLVATLPRARGRGLASELLTRALLDARARGCTTSTLVATKMGQPIYERLGYRGLGSLEMWERREP